MKLNKTNKKVFRAMWLSLITIIALVGNPTDAKAQTDLSDNKTGIQSNTVYHYDEKSGTYMDLNRNLDEIPIMLIYDSTVIELDNELNSDIDINKTNFSRKELAAILGVKPNQVKVYKVRKGNNAISIFGYRAFNGSIEVLSPKKYRQLKKESKLSSVLDGYNVFGNKGSKKYIKLNNYDFGSFSKKEMKLYNEANSRVQYEMGDGYIYITTKSADEINISPELFDLIKKRTEDYNKVLGGSIN